VRERTPGVRQAARCRERSFSPIAGAMGNQAIQRALLAAPAGTVQRKATAQEKAEARRVARLRELARWPGDAHSAWPKLSSSDRTLVLLQMAANYGDAFASQFLEEVKKKRKSPAVNDYFGRGTGPNSKEIRARGLRLAQKDSVHEWWVHPSGRTLIRNVSKEAPSAGAAEPETPGAGAEIEGTEDWPSQIDPNADRESMFGPVVASRPGGDLGFGTGYVLRYQDGTLESFVDGKEGSYLLRPTPGGGYLLYGPDGNRKRNSVYTFEPEEIP